MDPKNKNKLWMFVLSLALFICTGWTAYNFLPSQFHPTSLWDSMTILVFAVLLWYLVAIIKWQKLLGPKLRKFIRAGALALLLCMLFLNIGIAVSEYNLRKRPNIILISIDTLRADHLSCYGYEKKTTPNIDKFANDSIFFENAYSQWPTTVPTLNSIMTGCLLSNEHPGDLRSYFCDKTYLAEILSDKGYSTAAFTDHYVIGTHTGEKWGTSNAWYVVRKGFDTFRNLGKGVWDVTSHILTKKTTDWLENNYKNKFFLWVHYFDPHKNYIPLPEYEALFGFSKNDCGRIYNRIGIPEVRKIQDSLTKKELDCLIGLYDSEVFYVDKYIGVLLDKITSLDLWDNTVVIITSDYGEEFNERERIGHGTTIYNETIRVPLMIRIPGKSPAKINKNTATMDLFNIICDLASNKKMVLNDDDVISRSSPEGREMKPKLNDYAIISGDYKFIYNPDTGSEELFNLQNDVAEKNNLLTDSAFKAKKVELKQKLLSWISENNVEIKNPVKNSLENEKKLREQLKSLGYVK